MANFRGHGNILKYRLSVSVLIMNEIITEVDMNVAFYFNSEKIFCIEAFVRK